MGLGIVELRVERGELRQERVKMRVGRGVLRQERVKHFRFSFVSVLIISAIWKWVDLLIGLELVE